MYTWIEIGIVAVLTSSGRPVTGDKWLVLPPSFFQNKKYQYPKS